MKAYKFRMGSARRGRMGVVVLTGLVAVATAAPARAQRANGPYAAAFGPQQNENRVQGLDLGASFFGAYDRNHFPESTPTERLDPRLTESGASAGVAGSLTYLRRGDRARFMLTGGGAGRQYASSTDLFVTAYNAGTALTVPLARRLTLEGNAGAAYSPFYEFAPFLDSGSGFGSVGQIGSGFGSLGPLSAGFGFAAAAERNLGLNASVGLTSELTRRTSLFGTADRREVRLLDHRDRDLKSWGGRAGIRHRVGRGFGVHVAYGREQYEYSFDDVRPYVNETIDVGVDYGNALAISRRTMLTFSSSTVATRYLNDTHYRVNGSARLVRGFARTWSMWLGYNRDTDFRVGFRAPLLTDSVDAGVGGQLSWRIRWSAGTGYTRGAIGFGSDRFSAYSGTSRLDVALNRKLALYGQYAYYRYQLPQGSSALDLVPRFSRQVATVGLSLSVPLINQVRPPRPPQQP